MDMASLNNLLSFLEAVFNGGSDFNEPIRRCLDRMAEAEWANSDILLVSDGELRQPGPEVRASPSLYISWLADTYSADELHATPSGLILELSLD